MKVKSWLNLERGEPWHELTEGRDSELESAGLVSVPENDTIVSVGMVEQFDARNL